MQAEITKLQNNNSVTNITNREVDTKQISELQAALEKEQEINQKLQEQIANVREEQNIQTTFSPVTKLSTTTPLSELETNKWMLVGIPFVFLFIGFLFGMKVSANRIRKRLHGFTLK